MSGLNNRTSAVIQRPRQSKDNNTQYYLVVCISFHSRIITDPPINPFTKGVKRTRDSSQASRNTRNTIHAQAIQAGRRGRTPSYCCGKS